MLYSNLVREKYEKLSEKLKALSKNEIRIIAVTKAHPPELFKICSDLHIRHVGENRVQELREKCETYPEERKNLFVHFIGNLQSNKAKYLPGKIDSLDAVDSLEVIEKLTQKMDENTNPISVLIQINAGLEKNKSGFRGDQYENILAFAKNLLPFSKIKLEGLMAMGPTPHEGFDMDNKEYRQATKEAFQRTRQLKERLENDLAMPLPRLSMGMSDDYEIAVECGSTEIRIGSYLFGARPLRH